MRRVWKVSYDRTRYYDFIDRLVKQMSKKGEKLDKTMNILRVVIGICVISIIVTVIATNSGGKKAETVTEVEKPTETIVPTQTPEPTVTPVITIKATATQRILPTHTQRVSPTPKHTPVKDRDTGPKRTVKPSQKKENTPPKPSNTPVKPKELPDNGPTTPTPVVMTLKRGG